MEGSLVCFPLYSKKKNIPRTYNPTEENRAAEESVTLQKGVSKIPGNTTHGRLPAEGCDLHPLP